MDGTKKNFILAIVPDYNYYTDIAISADIYAVKLACQLDDRLKDKQQIAFFDEFIGQELGQKYNAKAVFEALNHSIDKNGDCSAYKGLSLADIDHAAIYCGIFLYNYREALSFLSLVDKFSPSKILIGADDANRGLFEEMAKQLGIETEIILSFATSFLKIDFNMGHNLGSLYLSPIKQAASFLYSMEALAFGLYRATGVVFAIAS